MKKYFNFLLTAALVGGLSLGYVSCSDDDDKKEAVTNVTVDEDLINHGIDVKAAGETVNVNVKMEGTWTASIENGSADDLDWATIENEHLTFTGSRTLKLNITANPTGADRNATLELFGLEGDPITVKIHQVGADVNAGQTNSALAFEGHGLGHGVDISYAMDTAAIAARLKSNPTAQFDWTHIKKENLVYNMDNIKKLVDNRTLNPQAYVESRIPTYDLQLSLIDSTVNQNKDFKVGINMNLTFGFIEFQAGVSYQAKKKEGRAHLDYSILRNAPMYNAVVSPLEIATYAADQSVDAIEKFGEEYAKLEEQVVEKYGSWEELQKTNKFTYNAWKKKLDKYRPNFGNVFSTGFSKLLWDYYKAMITGEEAEADKALAAIDESFSPFFITGGNWGGTMAILARIDTNMMKGKDSAYATLTGDLSQFGSVSGEMSLSTEGMELYRNMRIKLNILGGNPKVGDDVAAWLLNPNPTDYEKLQQVLKDWIATMVSPADEKATSDNSALPTEFFYTPVWTLMDTDYREYARNWFMKRYEKNTSVMAFLGISEGTRDEKGAGTALCGNKE